MLRCTHCDHFNSVEATQCERCGAPLENAAGDQAGEPASATGDAGSAFVQEILATVKKHGKITAIKQYREATGEGLKDAKESVEALMREHNVVASGGGSGCAGVVAALAILPTLACCLLIWSANR